MTSPNKRAYWLILMIYMVTMLPSYFYLNKYMVIGIPLLTTTVTLYLLRMEYSHIRINDLIGSTSLTGWVQKALISSLLLEILFHWITRNETASSVQYQLMISYPIMPVYMLLNAPLVEEVVFRKIIFGELDSRFNFWTGAIVSSILFGMLHNEILGFVLYFSVGFIFCYIYKKSQSIIPSLLAHAAMNLIYILNISLSMK